MNLFNFKLPKLKLNLFSKKKEFPKTFKKKDCFRTLVPVIIISALVGFLSGSLSGFYFYSDFYNYLKKINLAPLTNISNNNSNNNICTSDNICIPYNNPNNIYTPQTSEEQKIINSIKKISPAVVSIIISKDVPVFEQYIERYQQIDPFFGPLPFEFEIPKKRLKGTEKQEVGGGTGLIVSSDGIILTNKHVISFDNAEYIVYTNDGKKYPAKLLAKDPVQDLAIIKIDREKMSDQELRPFPVAKLGDSDKIELGQTVIAIGNALGEFRNTISVGVVSGLGRTITASGNSGYIEILEDVIQTDAAINKGNSGGPLLNLKGEVIGINVAMVEQAQSIGFAIPINKAKRDIEQVKSSGKITYPFLGVRYLLVNDKVKEKFNLPVDYGAYLAKGESGEPAVEKDSAADRAGLKEGDIILEFNNEKITSENSLANIIAKYNPGDKVKIKYLRDNEEKTAELILGEREK